MNPRPKRSRRSGMKWVILALAGAASLYFFRKHWGPADGPVYPPNAFYEVKRGDLLISLTEEGALRALNETVVRNGLEGLNRIIHLVPEGTHVKKGELLVELDSSALRDQLNEQELGFQEKLLQLLQAEGNFTIQKSLAESEIKAGEIKLDNAEADLEKYRDGDAPLLIRTAESRIGVLTEQVRIARERFARTQELFKSGNATQSELEADTLSLKREQLGLSQYEEDLRLIKRYDHPNQLRLLESNVLQARQELERIKQRSANEIAQAEADFKTSERTVTSLKEALATQNRRLQNAKIYAPQDGLVVYASVNPFSSSGGGFEGRTESGRSRGGRRGTGGGGGGGGSGGGSGEFRGGGQRGTRSGTESSSLGTFASSATANPTTGSATTATTPSGNQTGGSGGGGGSGGAGGGDGASRSSTSFATYPSLRASSGFASSSSAATGAGDRTGSSAGTSGSAAGSGSGGAGSSGSGSGSTTLNAGSGSSFNTSIGFRSSSQNMAASQAANFTTSSGVLEEGAMVRQRQELIRLPDVSRMVAEIRVQEARVRQVEPGMTAYVKIDNIPGRQFKGSVRRVAPLPDSQQSWLNPNSKVYPTDILIEDQIPELKPGISARAEIIITNLTAVLSVPIHTVVRLQGESVCYVKRGSNVVPVAVTPGWFNDHFIEITTGLQAGDRVLLAPVLNEPLDVDSPDSSEEVAAPSQSAPAPSPAQATTREPQPSTPRLQGASQESQDGVSPAGERPDRPRSGSGRERRPRKAQDSPE